MHWKWFSKLASTRTEPISCSKPIGPRKLDHFRRGEIGNPCFVGWIVSLRPFFKRSVVGVAKWARRGRGPGHVVGSKTSLVKKSETADLQSKLINILAMDFCVDGFLPITFEDFFLLFFLEIESSKGIGRNVSGIDILGWRPANAINGKVGKKESYEIRQPNGMSVKKWDSYARILTAKWDLNS